MVATKIPCLGQQYEWDASQFIYMTQSTLFERQKILTCVLLRWIHMPSRQNENWDRWCVIRIVACCIFTCYKIKNRTYRAIVRPFSKTNQDKHETRLKLQVRVWCVARVKCNNNRWGFKYLVVTDETEIPLCVLLNTRVMGKFMWWFYLVQLVQYFMFEYRDRFWNTLVPSSSDVHNKRDEIWIEQ